MKKIIFIVLALFILSPSIVEAKTDGFYEADYAGSIYIRRSDSSNTRYQRARFFKRISDNRIGYCIEPFDYFVEGTTYEEMTSLPQFSQEQILQMSLLSYYGYNYRHHTDIKWYAITQQLIWQVANPNAEYVFTDGLNGPTIYPYKNEIQELKNLVEDHSRKPIYDNSMYYIVEDQKLTLIDTNNTIMHYTSDHPNVTIKDNVLTAENLKEGTHVINLTRKATAFDQPALFYYNQASQDIMTIGNAQPVRAQLAIIVNKTKIEINKIDEDTKSTTASGEGHLEGAIYGLYDENNQKIQELKIDENFTAVLENIEYGQYQLKELQAGIGYQLDPTTYYIKLHQTSPIAKLTLANKIIKKKLQINKEYGTANNTKVEPGIEFEVYNRKGLLVTTLITDENGYAEVELPYGEYIIKQKNSTEGYEKNADFKISINEEENQLQYKLYDYKIPVPDTAKNNNYIFSILLLSGMFYGSKKQII